jgi:predicted nucleic acid-binding protein
MRPPSAAGTKARGRRALDLLIAATGLANDLAVYTLNPDDFGDLASLIDVVAIPPPA